MVTTSSAEPDDDKENSFPAVSSCSISSVRCIVGKRGTATSGSKYFFMHMGCLELSHSSFITLHSLLFLCKLWGGPESTHWGVATSPSQLHGNPINSVGPSDPPVQELHHWHSRLWLFGLFVSLLLIFYVAQVFYCLRTSVWTRSMRPYRSSSSTKR